MIDWIQQLKPNSNRLKNPAKLSTTALDLLREDFRQGDETYSGLSDVLLAYVVDGKCEEVLSKIRSLEDARLALNMVCHHAPGEWIPPSEPRRELFAKMHVRDGATLHRLGLLYHAIPSAQQYPSYLWEDLPSELKWFETLLFELIALSPPSFASVKEVPWEINDFVGALEAAGQDRGTFARILLREGKVPYGLSIRREHVLAIRGVGEYLVQFPEIVRHALDVKDSFQKASIIEFLNAHKTPIDPVFMSEIAKAASSSVKTIAQPAERYLVQTADAESAVDALAGVLVSGTAAERSGAAGILMRKAPNNATKLLGDHLAREKSRKVRSEIEQFLAVAESASQAEEDTDIVLPEVCKFDEAYRVSPEIESDFHDTLARFQKTIDARNESSNEVPAASPAIARKVLRSLETPDACRNGNTFIRSVHVSTASFRSVVNAFADRNRLPIVPRLRLAFQTCEIQIHTTPHYRPVDVEDTVIEWIGEELRQNDWTLLDLSAAMEAAGLESAIIGRLHFEVGWRGTRNPFGIPDESIWPYFVKYPIFIDCALGLSSEAGVVPDYHESEYRHRALELLTTFPRLPDRFLGLVWDAALGKTKRDRIPAQACLSGRPDVVQRVSTALNDKRKEISTIAAKWLGEIMDASAIKPLRVALKKAKDAVSKAVCMEALEKLGDDMDQFLNRKKLREDAAAALKKGLPKEINWFPFAELPTLHWAKNGQEVTVDTIKWFIAQSFHLKTLEGDPLIRRYLGLIRPNELARLGNLILNTWIAQDTLPKYTPEQATKKAEQSTQQMNRLVQQYPDRYEGYDEAAYRKRELAYYQNECKAHANASRGILAISAIACDADAVKPIERYIRYWYGRRLFQCKVLLQVLAGIDHPSAVQVILSLATRFRTAGIQKEAARLADEIAQRKSWTRDEMADRTVPTGGFDQSGRQLIDYGVRQFTATLKDDFSIEIVSPSGKALKSLPNPNKSEDATEVKEAKKSFSAAKKEVKEALKLQRERLYEAMCIGRQWRFDDWNRYLNFHPIVGRLCGQLVWMAQSADEPVVTFRPLPDLTLTDLSDDSPSLQPDDLIQLAHDAYLPKGTGKAWLDHFRDYSISPLFEQFGRTVSDAKSWADDDNAIDDFKGHLLSAFKLRSRMTKLNYTRGQAEDAGIFTTYVKRFPSLRLQAVVEFTGNCVPEEDRTVALINLHFVRIHDETEGRRSSWRPLQLSQIPGVVISECWNDFRTAANDGSGFDPDWEKKSEW